VGKYCRAGQDTDGSMAHALPCWISKATKTHSEYVICIDFPLQQWLHEHVSVLHYTDIISFVTVGFNIVLHIAAKLYFKFQQWRLVQVRMQ